MKRYKDKYAEITVIILDIEMPFMNGLEAAAEIRLEEKKRGSLKIPIIGLTGHDNVDVKQAALKAGMSIVLTKPVNFSDIVTVLRSATAGIDY